MSIDITKKAQYDIKSANSNMVATSLQQGKLFIDEPSYKESYVYFDLTLEDKENFNRITYDGQFGSDYSLQVYISTDGMRWEKLPVIHLNQQGTSFEAELPLTETKFLRVVIYSDMGLKLDFVKVTDLRVHFAESLKLSASSEADRLWVAENLIDGRKDYGWASAPEKELRDESIEVELTNLHYLESISLHSIHEIAHCFPSAFYIQLSLDRKIWHTVISESSHFVAAGSIYDWHFIPQRAKFIRIIITKSARLSNTLFQSKFLELQIFAKAENRLSNQLNSGELPVASELTPGAVKWAPNGSVSAYTAVQGNDPRLRKASAEFPGIVQLANPNESHESKVVMSNDPRLRPASETYPGIIQFAQNNEKRGSVAVQANDDRLRTATEDSLGIVQLGISGSTKPGVVVQGSDARLKESSEANPGIVQLASDGESTALKAVQGNDSRLKRATEHVYGITTLASHMEEASQKALQSDDPRLAEGTVKRRGRVQLAELGDSSPGKVVQSNDPRLNKATEKSIGLTRYAPHEVSLPNTAVQSDDPRLGDKRDPLPHTHSYAPEDHDLNSHKGTLNMDVSIEAKGPKPFQNQVYTDYPLSVKNKTGMAAGFSGGVYAYAENEPGVSVFSAKSVGIQSLSKSNPGLISVSQGDYAVHLPFELDGIESSGKSIHAEGEAHFESKVEVSARNSVAVRVTNIQRENYLEGDMMTISEAGQYMKVSKARQRVIGVVTTEEQGLNLGRSREGLILQIAGLVQLRVKGKAKPGDLLGYDGGDPGIASGVKEVASAVAVCLEKKSETVEATVLARLF